MIGALLRTRYEILQQIGDNPIMTTFIAHDRARDRNVVLKVIKEKYCKEHEFISELLDLSTQLKSIDEPGIAKLLDIEQDDGRWFMVCSYLPGSSVYDRLKRLSTLTQSSALTVIRRVLEALVPLHEKGHVHGDISARNVVVGSSDEAGLLLPGVWRAYSSSVAAGVEMLPLIAPYLAPEVTMGGMPSPQSDVYAVGVLLFEMLAGCRPYGGKTPAEIATQHVSSEYPSLTRLNTAVPMPLDELVKKAMAKKPGDRYFSAKAMLNDVKLLEDALRFGKRLTWPLDPQPETAADERVGPRLNVVRDQEAEKKMAKRRASARGEGVPRWMVGIFIVTASFAIAAIGVLAYNNLTKPKILTVPNIIGMTFAQATAELDEMDLKLKRVKQSPSDEYAVYVVMEVSPSVGQDIRQFSTVNAVVSTGSNFVEVPDLTGMTPAEARRLLASMNLALAAFVETVYDPSVPEGTIVSQKPKERTNVERQTKIAVQVSTHSRSVIDAPPRADSNIYTLRWQLPDSPFPIMLRVDVEDVLGTRTVHQEMYEPEENISLDIEAYGPKATFYIYYDGVLESRITQSARPDEDDDDGDNADEDSVD
ncbi:MAG: protein kinase [Armatimonadetes bacterium]|nr:protein kinase [Armatimonadota bacterium]